MSYPRWRKCTIPTELARRTDCVPYFWKLKVENFVGTIIDTDKKGEGFVGYVNGERVTEKWQRDLRQAKVIVLLAIRQECQRVLTLTDHMDTEY